MTQTPLSRSKGQRSRSLAALVGCTGRPTWTYSNGDLFICVHDVYRVTTCRRRRGHIVASARLRLVSFIASFNSSTEMALSGAQTFVKTQ